MSRKRKYAVAASREHVKGLIPAGYGVKIYKLAGVSERTLSRYWNGQIKSSPRIEKAIRTVIAELVAEETELEENMKLLDELKHNNKN